MQNDCEVKPKPKTIREFFRSSYFWKPFLSIVIGGLAGFLYYYFVGCTSGTCPITSQPLPSIITGGVFGFLFTSSPCVKCNS
ncbi:MAG TPA: DUF6132 family protein [Bacteroidales bacterium]|jgi:hypothetical protein|nr:DUF6132 family protein [Bacteroidales bacterium]